MSDTADPRPAPPLPNPQPRPPQELERLLQVWQPPRGWRFPTVVNNTYIGLLYLGTALLFFLLAGILALLMRTQLAVAENDFLSQERYNQFFTMHGTIMMFLFAVPAVEAMGVYLLPNMLAARDLPFPRLSAYAYWAYGVGGLIFFGSLFFDLAPSGGWFMYPPLTSYEQSPGNQADFWLLGIGFIEISAIAGAVEIVVGVLRTRAPGMSIDKLPVYAWAMLVVAAMIIFGFPAVILGTALLEIERSFHWPFFIAAKGGDPLLWQHLFWFFGHPEVYIIFLPAAGFVSMIIPTMARVPLVGYRLVVLSLIATGFIAFGVWVHHMFTVGLGPISVGFFTAASMAVALPSGVMVFAWIATLAAGRPRLTVPSLFVLGFLFIFTLGGLTGVMLGAAPFDWQVHDTFFVVGHFHYVLIGGMVFPFFGALYYWAPVASRTALSERLGRWVFGLMFTGFNLAFFPMHITGLLGMPRRVYTYPAHMGWDGLNLASTAGAYILALGILVFLIDLVLHFRPAMADNAGNSWGAGTMEWLPSDVYGQRSIPLITSREPLWEQAQIAENVENGHYFLPGTATGRRETIVTTAIDARPEYVLQIPGPSWPHVLAAWLTALCFFLLTIKIVGWALLCGALAIAMVLRWLWDTDPGHSHAPVDIGGGLRLPVYASGARSHAWWAVIVVLLVAASIFAAHVFSYFYLRLSAAHFWPGGDAPALPAPLWPLLSGALLAASSALWALARRGLRADRHVLVRTALFIALPLLTAAAVCELWSHWQSGLRPTQSGYGAVVYMTGALQGFYAAVLWIMTGYTLTRSFCGLLDAGRCVTFECTMLMWHYSVAQGLVGLALVHLTPRLLS